MIRISSETLRKARDIQEGLQEGLKADNKLLAAAPDDLLHWLGVVRGLLQTAIELEHSTIPPYLCAYFTLKLGTNQEVADIIRSVVAQEMLHMSIAANTLIAIGGAPLINDPCFVPTYPGRLPFGIAGVDVHLERCSIDLVCSTFMQIEAPEYPIPIKDLVATAALNGDMASITIGQFYEVVKTFITFLGDGIFDKTRFGQEMVDNTWFPPDQLFRIVDAKSACDAIDIIVKQGEGTPERPDLASRHEWTAYVHGEITTKPAPPSPAVGDQPTPLDPEGEPAHYYRFEEIVRGRKLVRDPRAYNNFAFTGPVVALDPANVWNMERDPDPNKLPDGSRARRLSVMFAYSYTMLLGMLHETFNGRPAAIAGAIGQMYELRLLAQEVLSTPVPGKPDCATGLSFRYQPTASELWVPRTFSSLAAATT
jgi:hypothetical protein